MLLMFGLIIKHEVIFKCWPWPWSLETLALNPCQTHWPCWNHATDNNATFPPANVIKSISVQLLVLTATLKNLTIVRVPQKIWQLSHLTDNIWQLSPNRLKIPLKMSNGLFKTIEQWIFQWSPKTVELVNSLLKSLKFTMFSITVCNVSKDRVLMVMVMVMVGNRLWGPPPRNWPKLFTIYF